jgi:hypothetical protein
MVIGAIVAAVLPFFIPYATFIGPSATSDTFALLPWWWVQDQGIHFDVLRYVVLGVAVAAAVFLFLPRRYVLVLPVLVGLYFVATSFVVENGRHGIHRATLASLFEGIDKTHPDWIDRLVGHNAHVAYLWSGDNNGIYTLWENEFFNRSLTRVLTLSGPGSDVFEETPVVRQGNSIVTAATGAPIYARYVLTDGSTEVRGKALGEDQRLSVRLYKVDGPVELRTSVTGLWPDTWSGKDVTYKRLDCTGGALDVLLQTDAGLYTTDQVVTARVLGRKVASVRIAPTAQVTMHVPLRPVPGTHTCVVRFETARTLVPAKVHPKVRPPDTRALGAHFLSFTPVP